MPKIQAATNAEQREHTKHAILESFGQLLYQQGLTGLTMTHVARNAGIGRTAVYNYFADMGELLIAFTMDETDRFMRELHAERGFVRAQETAQAMPGFGLRGVPQPGVGR